MDLPQQPEDEIPRTGEAIAPRPVPDSIDPNIRTDTSSAIEALLDAHHQRTAQELRHRDAALLEGGSWNEALSHDAVAPPDDADVASRRHDRRFNLPVKVRWETNRLSASTSSSNHFLGDLGIWWPPGRTASMSCKNLYYYLLLFVAWCVLGLGILVLLRWLLSYTSK
ncbi:hypothetical protein HPB47_006337 [Ixodes persulcatus]|uniref:Uncharacterized protein n=1 Tax=Ixodes persulcatus TaxID=34615 RepID=A0AC60PAH0_IXOPE|nr:hypothetical protein HPB47_006337 [Ixodes persulcatus]